MFLKRRTHLLLWILGLPLFSTCCLAQVSFIDKLSIWKGTFPKEEVVAASYKETVDFTFNPNAKMGASKVGAIVTTEVMLVPMKDYLKWEDGLFSDKQSLLDNVSVWSAENKELKLEKLCSSYRDDDIFHSDARICVVKIPFTEKGKAFRYTYKMVYPDIKYLTSFYFHKHIPVADRTIQFNVPSWLEFDTREFHFENQVIEKSTGGDNAMHSITYHMKDAGVYRREPSAPGHALSLPHILCLSKAVNQGGSRTVLFESTKDLYGWYKSLCDSIGNKPELVKDKVAELTANRKTDLEKVEAIFYWVQDNVRYIAFEDGIMGFKPDAAQNVFKNKYGDCKGKANLLKEMLKLAGFDARLTWIGTTDLPYDYSIPSLAVDNHMICTLLLNGKRYFLDGTEECIALNDYAQRIQGKQVLIEDGANFILDRIPAFSADRNKVKSYTRLQLQDNKLSGNIFIEYNGESKVQLLRYYISTRNDQKKDPLSAFLRHNNENVSVTSIKDPDLANRQKPLEVSFDLSVNNQVTKAANEIYVNMDWNKEFSSMEFDNDRKNDYEFDQKYFYTFQTELVIPDGYKVDYLPAAFKKTTPEYSFEGSYLNKGKSIVYSKTIVINKPIVRKSEFGSWNAFVQDINKFYNDQIVLKK